MIATDTPRATAPRGARALRARGARARDPGPDKPFRREWVTRMARFAAVEHGATGSRRGRRRVLVAAQGLASRRSQSDPRRSRRSCSRSSATSPRPRRRSAVLGPPDRFGSLQPAPINTPRALTGPFGKWCTAGTLTSRSSREVHAVRRYGRPAHAELVPARGAAFPLPRLSPARAEGGAVGAAPWRSSMRRRTSSRDRARRTTRFALVTARAARRGGLRRARRLGRRPRACAGEQAARRGHQDPRCATGDRGERAGRLPLRRRPRRGVRRRGGARRGRPGSRAAPTRRARAASRRARGAHRRPPRAPTGSIAPWTQGPDAHRDDAACARRGGRR